MSNKDELFEENIGAVSEGWWASVMEEDDCNADVVLRSDHIIVGEAVHEKENANKGDDINWNLVDSLFRNETVITGTVIDFNKGGLLVCSDDLQGFVPISHLDDVLCLETDEARLSKLENYIGCQLMLKVIECDQRRGRVVLSERAAQSEPGQRKKLLDRLRIGEKVEGRVTNITDFGVFVDLGGVEGLVHISELSWGRVMHPKNHIQINQMIEVLILQINRDQCRVSLSVKRLKPNPWADVHDRYPKGRVLVGTITEIVKYGAFAKLEDGLEGLIHISEMGFSDGGAIQEVISEGQEVNVAVVLVDSDRQRMSLRLVD